MGSRPIWGRVLARQGQPSSARGDTRTLMPLSKLPCRCSPRFANGFGKTRNCVSIMSKLKIYIPGVSLDRARELFLQHIDSDPSLESLRELYD